MPAYDADDQFQFVDCFPGDAPVSHPAFADATMSGHAWHIRRYANGKDDAGRYADSLVRHLRSWGITAQSRIE